MSLQSTDIAGKRLELLLEIVPRVRQLAVMFEADAAAVLEAGKVQAAARQLGVEVVLHEKRRVEDIAPLLMLFSVAGWSTLRRNGA